jgi:hypothetical protein
MEKKEIFKQEFKSYETHLYQDHLVFENYRGYDKSKIRKGIFELSGESHHDEESFLENYSNLMYAVTQRNKMIVLEESGDKLSLKLFISVYHRRVGIRFFGKIKNCYFLTVNRRTGDFYVGHILNYQNKRKFTKVIRKNPCNYLGMISEQLSMITSPYKNNLHDGTIKRNLLSEFSYGLGFHNFPEINYDMNNIELAKSLVRYSLLKKGVKLPNNFNAFIDVQYLEHLPKFNVLKKHNLKFIDAFMSHHGISGNEIKKNLHVCNHTNIHSLRYTIKYFGYDKVYQNKIILDLLNQPNNNCMYNFPDDFTKSEKEKIFTYFKWQLNGDINQNTLNDHIMYYNQLKTYGEQVSLNAKTIDDFVTEHANWSVLISTYKQGYHVRNYNDGFVDNVEQSIYDFSGIEYQPVLLRSSDEYNEESAYQNNCVRTYIDKCPSVIVSLRNANGVERGTIEYMLNYDPSKKKLNIKRVQYLGKFNKSLPESWNHIMEILDGQVNKALNSETFEMSMKTQYINNKTVTKEMILKEPNEPQPGQQYIGLVQWDKTIGTTDNFDFNLDF